MTANHRSDALITADQGVEYHWNLEWLLILVVMAVFRTRFQELR